jgi:hypothetical protein
VCSKFSKINENVENAKALIKSFPGVFIVHKKFIL